LERSPLAGNQGAVQSKQLDYYLNHTSARKRIKEVQRTPTEQTEAYQPKTLFPFVGKPREPMPAGYLLGLKTI
jgi:hypothetical protein